MLMLGSLFFTLLFSMILILLSPNSLSSFTLHHLPSQSHQITAVFLPVGPVPRIAKCPVLFCWGSCNKNATDWVA